MASVIESAKKVYRGDDSFATHLFFVIMAMIIGYSMMLLGPKSLTAAVIVGVVMYLFTAYTFVIMHGTIKDSAMELPDFNLNTLTVGAQAIPVFIGGGLVCLVINWIFAFIPVIGPLIGGVLVTLLSSLMILQYCKNYKKSDAFDFNKIKELLSEFFIPFVILNLKFLLVITVACLIGGIMSFLSGNSMFVNVIIVFYFLFVVQIIYFDTLAQLYAEISIL